MELKSDLATADSEPMRGRARTLTVAVALAVAAGPAGASAASAGQTSGRQTKREAEVALLSAPRRLARFAPALVDKQTGLLHSNTRASCRGLDRAVHGRHHVLRCVVSHGRTRLVLRYTAVGRATAKLARLAA